jgi:hypothetical protein
MNRAPTMVRPAANGMSRVGPTILGRPCGQAGMLGPTSIQELKGKPETGK